jgi:division protein CdvB (Snf7/Vps24/ESCRT-III family)
MTNLRSECESMKTVLNNELHIKAGLMTENSRLLAQLQEAQARLDDLLVTMKAKDDQLNEAERNLQHLVQQQDTLKQVGVLHNGVFNEITIAGFR